MMIPASVVLAAGMMMIAACSSADNPAGRTNPPDQEHPFAVARAVGVQRDVTPMDPEVLRGQAAGSNRFAVALYHQLAKADENLFFSPFSLEAALGMTAAGARNQTGRQILEALHATLDGDAFHAALNGLEQVLEDHVRSTDGVELNMVNSLWAQRDFELRASYLDLLARAYGAGVNLLDFAAAPEASRRIIDDWVSEETRNRIQDLLPPGSISADTRLVLTNAVYFLAKWRYRFDPTLTTQEPFHRLDGSTVARPLMQLGKNGESVAIEYARDPESRIRAVNLYYRGDRLCMTVLLPDAGAFRAYEDALSMAAVERLLGSMRETRLPPVRLPRFTYTSSSLSLRRPLQALGIHDAFDPERADFSGIDGRRDLHVSAIVHKAFVAVDEEGTQAAAATGVVVGVTSVPQDPPRFVADRPFIFLVRDTETGLILFMGRLLDPGGAN